MGKNQRKRTMEGRSANPDTSMEFVEAASARVKALIPIALLMLIGLAGVGTVLMAISRG